MFNIFNVSTQKENDKDNISVEINNNAEITEEDIGQVALDILENDDFVTIIAPLA
jgi:hypothetical protein